MFRLAVLLAVLPAAALAVGPGFGDPPDPSPTTTDCAEGLVWDIATETCLPPEESTNDDAARLGDVRELAHAGLYGPALEVLRTMERQSDPLVLTYYGFVTRKLGDMDGGLAFYRAALDADPDLALARAYLGMAFVEMGRADLARAELVEIRMRDGRGGWPEVALARAIATGIGSSY